MTHDPRYLEGIRHFNARRFFEAHEVWEDLWHEEHGLPNPFIQGLIQFATALHHFEACNFKGTKILYESGVELLKPFGEKYWDLPVRELLEDMSVCVKELLPYSQQELPGRYHPDKKKFPVQIKEELIPKIMLVTNDH